MDIEIELAFFSFHIFLIFIFNKNVIFFLQIYFIQLLPTLKMQIIKIIFWIHLIYTGELNVIIKSLKL